MFWRIAGLSIIAVYLIFSAADLAPAGQAERRPLDCAAALKNIKLALAQHILVHKLGESVVERTVDRFRELVLAQNELLTSADIARLKEASMSTAMITTALKQGRCDFFEEKSAVLQNALVEVRRELVSPTALERRLLRFKKPRKFDLQDTQIAPGVLSAIQKKSAPHDSRTQRIVGELAAQFDLWRGRAIKQATARFIARRYFNRLARLEDGYKNLAYEGLLRAFMYSLDPNSNFYNAAETELMTKSSFASSYSGIGVFLAEATPYGARILGLVPGGAAEASGKIKSDDVIMSVERRSIIGLELEQLHPILTGFTGSKILLHVASVKARRLVNHRWISLERGSVSQSTNAISVTSRTVDGQYIVTVKLSKFYSGCALDVRNKLIEQMKAAGTRGINAIVLDLRGNGGGVREEAVALAGTFLTKGPIFVVKMSRNFDEGRDLDETKFSGQLIVAIDRATASAAELVAGALKDYKRAIVVGDDQSFGKGTTQRVFNEADGVIGGSVLVTIGQLYSPSGRTTQLVGVKSDIVVPGPRAKSPTAGQLGARLLAPESQSVTTIGVMNDKEFEENADLTLDFILPTLQAQSSLRLMTKPATLSSDEQLDEIERVAADFSRKPN